MSWVYAAVAVGGALIGGIASNRAANTQSDAANNATAAQQGMFGTTQQNLQPYMEAGRAPLAQLVSGTQPGGDLMPQSYTPYDIEKFKASPEYQIMMQQNAEALNASQNASSLSGGANSNNMKSLMGWTQGNAVNQYQTGLSNYLQQFLTGNQAKAQQFGTYQTLAGMGQNAAAGLGDIGTKVGGQIGENIIGAGNAQAAGTVGVGNAITGAMGQGYNSWLQQQYLNKYALNNGMSGAEYSNAEGVPITLQ